VQKKARTKKCFHQSSWTFSSSAQVCF